MPHRMLPATVRYSVCILLLAVMLIMTKSAFAQTAGESPRLLVVVESDSRLPLAQMLLNGIEAQLAADFTTTSEIYVEYLDMLRFNDPVSLDYQANFLAARFASLDLDAIAVLGPNALAFVLEHRAAIAPGVPIIFGGLGDTGLKSVVGKVLPKDVTGVISMFDLLEVLELAMAVQQDAKEIVVVAGSANFDLQWRATATQLLGKDYLGLPVRLLPEATYPDTLAEVAKLDPSSIVLLLTFNRDSKGKRLLPVAFAKALAAASPAPVWTLYESQIGTGIVGGHMESLGETGKKIGTLLRLAVAGSPLPEPVRVSAVPTVDWRAMRQHDLDLGLLPENSRILFYEPSLWEQYRLWILAISAVVAAQTVSIIGLMYQRRRYIQTQASLDLERSQLIHVSRNMRLGQLSASLAHEINQPLAAIQANAEAGTRIAGRTPPDLDEISAIFRDINDDVRRAGSTISNLRRLMVKGEVAMDRLDLNEIVAATLPLAQNELAAKGTKVRPALSPNPVEVTGDGPQLQQIVLNLVLNASEAMDELPEAARTVRVTTATLPGGEATLTVEDAGPGVPPDWREEAFRPFISSKSSGLGVGLAICRSIAQAHGGSLAFVDPVGSGARIVLTLPKARADARADARAEAPAEAEAWA